MVSEQEFQESTRALCLRVSAESDPSTLARVVGHFQTLNILPRRVVAEFRADATLHIRVDVTGLTEHHLSKIAAKIGQIPSIEHAYWHRL